MCDCNYEDDLKLAQVLIVLLHISRPKFVVSLVWPTVNKINMHSAMGLLL